jgi:von Willebrand factor type D domain
MKIRPKELRQASFLHFLWRLFSSTFCLAAATQGGEMETGARLLNKEAPSMIRDESPSWSSVKGDQWWLGIPSHPSHQWSSWKGKGMGMMGKVSGSTATNSNGKAMIYKGMGNAMMIRKGKGKTMVMYKGKGKSTSEPQALSLAPSPPSPAIAPSPSENFGYCALSIAELMMVGSVVKVSVAEIDNFLISDTEAIPELQAFVNLVGVYISLTFPGDDRLPNARQVITGVMLPKGVEESRALAPIDFCDTDILERCVKAGTALYIELVNFILSCLPGFPQSIGQPLGVFLAKKFTDNIPLFQKVLKIAKRKNQAIADEVGDLLTTVLGDLSVNAWMDAFDQIPDLNWADKATLVVEVAVGIAAIFAKVLIPGFGWAILAGEKSYATINIKSARRDFAKACECGAPTPSPTFLRPPIFVPPLPPIPSGDFVSGVIGDPHLSTFDRLRFDCQAAGEFTMVTSLETPAFRIQERFTAIGSDVCSQASVSTGIAVAEVGFSTVQVSIPRGDTTGSNFIWNCPVDLFVGGQQTTLTQGTGLEGVQVTISGSDVTITYPSTGLRVRASIRSSATFGCFFLAQVFLPFSYRPAETILGLLGTPNNNRNDDWRGPDGQVFPPPADEAESVFSRSYNYCVDNWCIRQETESIFTYRDDESFASIFGCDEDYGAEIEEAVNNAQEDLRAICGTDLSCLVDGICGSLADAETVLQDAELVAEDQQQSNPLPTFEPSKSPSLSVLPSDSPSISPTC